MPGTRANDPGPRAIDRFNTLVHIQGMAKPSHRDVILSKGMEVMHRQGYNGTSVRDIVRAAGVPQGSFTNHFASKEVFALEALDLYHARGSKMMRETLGNEALAPLARIRAYVEVYRSLFRQRGCQHGCLCGNVAAEASDQSEPLRKRTAEIFEDLQRRIVDCLKAAAKAGEVSRPMKYDEVANFIIGGLQGALLLGKSSRSLQPLEQFERILFAQVLR
jgi:TetR/AcrR family transcriptional repressor of nem operon